jgi:hypothetical protein
MEFHDRLPKADPGEHAAHEAVAFRHRQEAVERLAVDETKIADVAWNFDVAEAAEQAIEQVGGQPFESAFALSRKALGVDDLIARFPFGDHFEHDLGRVLQIGVHDDDGLAGCALHAGRDRDLMAEIARQPHEAVARIRARLGLEHDRARIARAVVDEYDFRRAIEAGEQGVQTMQQHRKNRFLVEDRHDQRINGSHLNTTREGPPP